MSTEDSRRNPTDSELNTGKLLVEGGFFTRDKLEEALAELGTGKTLKQVLIEREFIAPETYTTFLSIQTAVPMIDLHQVTIERGAIALVPEEVARKYNVLPIDFVGDDLRVAMEDPQNTEALRELATITGRVIRPRIPLFGDISHYLENYSQLLQGTDINQSELYPYSHLASIIPLVFMLPDDLHQSLNASYELYLNRHRPRDIRRTRRYGNAVKSVEKLIVDRIIKPRTSENQLPSLRLLEPYGQTDNVRESYENRLETMIARDAANNIRKAMEQLIPGARSEFFERLNNYIESTAF